MSLSLALKNGIIFGLMILIINVAARGVLEQRACCTPTADAEKPVEPMEDTPQAVPTQEAASIAPEAPLPGNAGADDTVAKLNAYVFGSDQEAPPLPPAPPTEARGERRAKRPASEPDGVSAGLELFGDMQGGELGEEEIQPAAFEGGMAFTGF